MGGSQIRLPKWAIKLYDAQGISLDNVERWENLEIFKLIVNVKWIEMNLKVFFI